jgi:hypothetical protein
VSTGPPPITPDMARAEMRKLLPHPGIGTAPAGSGTLVNIETVLWDATSEDLDLGTATLLGRRVGLRAHLDHVDWTFGDDETDTTTSPGTPYSDNDPCRTVECPGYYGHTYRRTGHIHVDADLSWHGEFSVDGGAWQPIPGTADAAATTTDLRVEQARAVLVPNP